MKIIDKNDHITLFFPCFKLVSNKFSVTSADLSFPHRHNMFVTHFSEED